MSYDPAIGRFMEEDPDVYIDGPNRYQAELSNPIIFLDPSGTAVQITLTNGQSYQLPVSLQALEQALDNAADGSIAQLDITGHGGDSDGIDSMELGDHTSSWFNETGVDPNKDFVTAESSKNGTRIFDGKGRDITDLIKKKFAPKGRLNLNGCHTNGLAKKISDAVPGIFVDGEKGLAHRLTTNFTYSFNGDEIFYNGHDIREIGQEHGDTNVPYGE